MYVCAEKWQHLNLTNVRIIHTLDDSIELVIEAVKPNSLGVGGGEYSE